MLKVKDMAMGEMQALLLSMGFGHLGYTRGDHPYVVPMHGGFGLPSRFLIPAIEFYSSSGQCSAGPGGCLKLSRSSRSLRVAEH